MVRDILGDAEGAADRGAVGPGKANRELDKPNLPKRFYEKVCVEQRDQNWHVLLDGKVIRTPGKNTLAFNFESVARMVANEWDAVGERLDPMQMPLTRLSNTAFDGVALEPQAVLEDIVKYSGSDLLCYRAASPQKLVDRQRKAWDPPLDWIADSIGARFETVEGIMHKAQPKEAIADFSRALRVFKDPLAITALHSLTSLSGSAILGYTLAQGRLDAQTAWSAAHVDEDWNIEQWGEDQEASKLRAVRWREFDAADRLIRAIHKL